MNSSAVLRPNRSHSETPPVEATRTRLQIDRDDCVGCGACANESPMHIIVPDGMYYRIGDGCIRCYACGNVCPVGAVYYACMN